MTTEIRFYHLQKQTPQQALISLIERATQKQAPILVKAKDKAEMEAINAHLWTYQPESFLPHETEESKNAATQPLLVSTTNDNENNASIMFQLNDGIVDCPTEITLCCKIFDGSNDAQIISARAEWKRLKDLGANLSYWQQDDTGKWDKKA